MQVMQEHIVFLLVLQEQPQVEYNYGQLLIKPIIYNLEMELQEGKFMQVI